MKSINALPFFLLLAATTGCGDFFNQIVDIEIPEHEPSLSVTAHFEAQDTSLIVYVSRSAGILDSVYLDSVRIKDATVTVLRDGALWQTVPHVGEGHYYLAMDEAIGTSPHSYTLQITAPGYESVESRQDMPAFVPIQEATFTAQGGLNPDGDEVNTLVVEFEDPAGEDNFYYLEALAFIPDTFSPSGYYTYKLGLGSEDALVEYHDTGVIFKDGPIDGKKYALKTWFQDSLYEIPGARLTVRLHSISRDRYLFLRTLDLYDGAQDNPFAEPVLVHNNIEGGVGIFTVGSVAERVIEF